MDDLGGKPTIFGNIHIDIQKMIAMYTLIAHWLPSAVVVLEWVLGTPKTPDLTRYLEH